MHMLEKFVLTLPWSLFISYLGHFSSPSMTSETLFDILDTEGTSSLLLCLDMACNAWSKFLPPQCTSPLAWGHSPLQHTETSSPDLERVLCQEPGQKFMFPALHHHPIGVFVGFAPVLVSFNLA